MIWWYCSYYNGGKFLDNETHYLVERERERERDIEIQKRMREIGKERSREILRGERSNMRELE